MLRVALILPQAGDQLRQSRQGLLPGEERDLGLAGGEAGEQLHGMADGGQLGEGAEGKLTLRVLVPALDRVAADLVEQAGGWIDVA